MSMAAQIGSVLISGGTGYMGRALSNLLLARGWNVRVLARSGSESKVVPGAQAVCGNALRAETFANGMRRGETLVHLTGVAHPAPWKETEFRAVDLASLHASVAAAKAGGAAHFVYVSVAHPAPVMHAYIRVRQECETILAESGLRRSILRPWYVLGPGHRWPVVLSPLYAALERSPKTRAGALRLGLVTLEEMTGALAWATEHPPEIAQILGVPEIRARAAESY
jgi:uncharacterized protein YbjT (DUF2867 family)